MAMVGLTLVHCVQCPISSFRIFILEGTITVVISLFAYFIVPSWSHNAKFVGFVPMTMRCSYADALYS